MEQGPRPPISPEVSRPSGQAAVLVVDDNPYNLDVAVQLLQQESLDIAIAVDGEMALEVARLTQPQLILLDVMLPDISGFEICRQLKQEAAFEHTPVVFMTALQEAQDKQRGFAAGGVDYITKPFDALEFLARVRNQLRLQTQIQRLWQENETLKQHNQVLQVQQQSVEASNLQLQKLIHIDGLTQVANRCCFDTHLPQEWLRLRRDRAPLSLILFDLDYFKEYNDHYGHPAGDRCLRAVAQAVNQLFQRPSELVARYGGEEFVIILPGTDATGVKVAGDRVQRAIAALRLPHSTSPVRGWVTISLGMSTVIPALGSSPAELLQSADQALYEAKNRGRAQSRFHRCPVARSPVHPTAIPAAAPVETPVETPVEILSRDPPRPEE